MSSNPSVSGLSFVASLAALSLVGACSSSSDANTSNGVAPNDSTAVMLDFCQAVHDSSAVCDPEEAATKLEQCKTTRTPCYTSTIRADVLAVLDQCAKSQRCVKGSSAHDCSCTPNEDACSVQAVTAVSATAAGDAFEVACKAKFAECGGSSNSFLDDYCVGSMYTDDVYGAFQKCLELACGNGTIGLCLKQTMLEKSGGKCDKNNY